MLYRRGPLLARVTLFPAFCVTCLDFWTKSVYFIKNMWFCCHNNIILYKVFFFNFEWFAILSKLVPPVYTKTKTDHFVPPPPPGLELVIQPDQSMHGRIQRGDRRSGTPPPPENHKNIGFLCNTGPDPLKKNHKAAKPEFNVGPSSARQRNAISMAFRWRVDDDPIKVAF